MGLCDAQVLGAAVERATGRSTVTLCGSRELYGSGRNISISIGGWGLAPSGVGRVWRTGHAARRLPPALPAPHTATRSQFNPATAIAVGWPEK